MVMERAGGHARRGCDLMDAGRVESLPLKQIKRGI
jgi:hypothetical protein